MTVSISGSPSVAAFVLPEIKNQGGVPWFSVSCGQIDNDGSFDLKPPGFKSQSSSFHMDVHRIAVGRRKLDR